MSKPSRARELQFSTLDHILAEAKRIAAQSEVASNGSWTPAQNIWHVGRFIKAGVEGYPAKVPFFLKLVGPLFKKQFTTKGFNPGIKLPKQAADHMVASADTTIEQAMDMIETAVQGAKRDGFLPRNPMMGKMTPQEWIDLHCRHAEMHFGMIDLKD